MSLKPCEKDFAETWNRLNPSIKKVIMLEPLNRATWRDNFHDVYELCQVHGDRLYEQTKGSLENHIGTLQKEIDESNEETILETYSRRWDVFYKGVKFVNSLYRCLNLFLKKQTLSELDMLYGGVPIDQVRTGKKEIGDLAFDIWKRTVISSTEPKLSKLLLSAINRDREGHPVNQGVVIGVVQSLAEVDGSLELYRKILESNFLAGSSEYYKAEAARLLASCNTSEYMRKALTLMNDEDLRARKFLHASSYEKVSTMCRKIVVAEHLDLFNASAKQMIDEELKDDLQNMYTLVKPVQLGLNVLVSEFENRVARIGIETVENVKGKHMPQQFVENTKAMLDKYIDFARTVFQKDKAFIEALDKAGVVAINHRKDAQSLPIAPKWLSEYTDSLLRKFGKGLTNRDLDEKLTNVAVIFRYVEDKDVFQKYYQRMLAFRLIEGLSVSMDAEESMIKKLKEVCGYEFTCKLHRMFADVGVSGDLTTQFIRATEQAQGEQRKLDVGFKIQVLRTGAWPFVHQSTTNFTVPRELSKSVKLFEEFYKKKFAGRKLTWLYQNSTAEVRLNYLPKTYLITMSVHAMAVLFHYNVAEKSTVEELKSVTQLSDDVLQKHVKSLVQSGLLLCEKIDALDDKAEIVLNMKYANKNTRSTIAAPSSQKHAKKEVEQVKATVQQDRQGFLKCAIVRIMKDRKVLKLDQLILKVIDLSRNRFVPETAFIKKVIEQLIEGQYLARTENADEFSYLA